MRCSTCKLDKVETEFYFHSRTNKTYQSSCKLCMKEHNRKSYLRHKENRYRKQREWQTLNREHWKMLNTMYKNLHRGQPFCDCCTWEDFKDYFVSRPEGFHVDHIQPIKNGGINCLKNMQYLTHGEHTGKTNIERGRLEL